MDKVKKIAFIFLLTVFSGVFVVSAFFLGRYWLDSKQQSDKYDNLAQQVAQIQQAVGSEDYVPEVIVTAPYADPETNEQTVILPEYAQLYLENPDMVGWINIPDAKVNYPVMQTPDNPDDYLHRNFQKEANSHGTLYIKETCDVSTPSDNLTIYGHNMKDGSMFAGLTSFKKQSFWETHRTFTFDTLTEHHTYEIFAVFTTTASVGKGFSYHKFINAADQAEYDEFVETCKRLSHYDTGITPEYGDKLICLSTCEYSIENGRFVVAARRIS